MARGERAIRWPNHSAATVQATISASPPSAAGIFSAPIRVRA